MVRGSDSYPPRRTRAQLPIPLQKGLLKEKIFLFLVEEVVHSRRDRKVETKYLIGGIAQMVRASDSYPPRRTRAQLPIPLQKGLLKERTLLFLVGEEGRIRRARNH